MKRRGGAIVIGAVKAGSAAERLGVPVGAEVVSIGTTPWTDLSSEMGCTLRQDTQTSACRAAVDIH